MTYNANTTTRTHIVFDLRHAAKEEHLISGVMNATCDTIAHLCTMGILLSPPPLSLPTAVAAVPPAPAAVPSAGPTLHHSSSSVQVPSSHYHHHHFHPIRDGLVSISTVSYADIVPPARTTTDGNPHHAPQQQQDELKIDCLFDADAQAATPVDAMRALRQALTAVQQTFQRSPSTSHHHHHHQLNCRAESEDCAACYGAVVQHCAMLAAPPSVASSRNPQNATAHVNVLVINCFGGSNGGGGNTNTVAQRLISPQLLHHVATLKHQASLPPQQGQQNSPMAAPHLSILHFALGSTNTATTALSPTVSLSQFAAAPLLVTEAITTLVLNHLPHLKCTLLGIPVTLGDVGANASPSFEASSSASTPSMQGGGGGHQTTKGSQFPSLAATIQLPTATNSALNINCKLSPTSIDLFGGSLHSLLGHTVPPGSILCGGQVFPSPFSSSSANSTFYNNNGDANHGMSHQHPSCGPSFSCVKRVSVETVSEAWLDGAPLILWCGTSQDEGPPTALPTGQLGSRQPQPHDTTATTTLINTARFKALCESLAESDDALVLSIGTPHSSGGGDLHDLAAGNFFVPNGCRHALGTLHGTTAVGGKTSVMFPCQTLQYVAIPLQSRGDVAHQDGVADNHQLALLLRRIIPSELRLPLPPFGGSNSRQQQPHQHQSGRFLRPDQLHADVTAVQHATQELQEAFRNLKDSPNRHPTSPTRPHDHHPFDNELRYTANLCQILDQLVHGPTHRIDAVSLTRQEDTANANMLSTTATTAPIGRGRGRARGRGGRGGRANGVPNSSVSERQTAANIVLPPAF